jgi:phage tail tape-measure protein
MAGFLDSAASAIKGAFQKTKDAVVGTVAPAVPAVQPAAAAVTPTYGIKPEGAGYTSTGGRRHRKTKALRAKRRTTRKTTRRVRKSKKGGRKH